MKPYRGPPLDPCRIFGQSIERLAPGAGARLIPGLSPSFGDSRVLYLVVRQVETWGASIHHVMREAVFQSKSATRQVHLQNGLSALMRTSNYLHKHFYATCTEA